MIQCIYGKTQLYAEEILPVSNYDGSSSRWAIACSQIFAYVQANHNLYRKRERERWRGSGDIGCYVNKGDTQGLPRFHVVIIVAEAYMERCCVNRMIGVAKTWRYGTS